MGILDNHKKKEVRFKKGDLIIYEPSEEQREEIVGIIKDSNITLEDNKAQGSLNVKEFRWLMRNITSVGHEIDELTDTELIEKLSEGDRDLTLFVREIGVILDEILEDIHYETYEFITTMEKAINIMNSKDSEEKIKMKINKLLKKKNIGLTFDELIQAKDNPELIESKLKKKKKK